MEREELIRELEKRIRFAAGGTTPVHADVLMAALDLLKEREDSTLGMKITPDGITFTSKGDAKQGEQRGLWIGKTMMLEHIKKELLYEKLLTDEVKAVLDRVKRRLISDL